MNPLSLFVNMSIIDGIFVVLCFGLCIYYHYMSYKNKLKGHIDNGAQYATSTGVFFTFIGITIALLSFDTQDIEKSIKGFISGMSVAFITSLIGIFFGYFIRKMQDSVEMNAGDAVSSDIRRTAEKSNQITESMAEIASLIKAQNENTLTNNQCLQRLIAYQENGTDQLLLSAITKLEESIRTSSSGQLSMEIRKLSDSLQEYVEASKESSATLRDIPAKLEGQASVIRELAAKLEESNGELAKQLHASNADQIQRMDRMNETISDMKEFSNKMYENSNKSLEESRTFQSDSLGYSDKQIGILQDNTKQIVAMKESFNEFLEKMAKNNNREFIKALNESMKDLNQKLTEQFGENFKELNHAVTDLLDWQKQYKQIIEETTDELRFINNVFSQFSTDIQPQIIKMSESIKQFSDTSEKNVDVQKSLLNTTEQLQANNDNLFKIYEAFNDFSQELTKKTTDCIEEFSDNVSGFMEENREMVQQEMEALSKNISNLKRLSNDISISTQNSMTQFNKASENVMQHVGNTLESFDTDFKQEIETSMKKLEQNLQTILQNTGEQGDKSVKTLAATLGKITERMTGNYIALVDRIEKVDKMLSNR